MVGMRQLEVRPSMSLLINGVVSFDRTHFNYRKSNDGSASPCIRKLYQLLRELSINHL